MINLTELNIYPIKSTAQVSLNSAVISPFGLDMDRRWMLVDEKGYMLTQRTHPRMCLIKPHLTDTQLIINATEMAELSVSINDNMQTIQATVWEDNCNALDCGDEAADWFSTFLNSPTRLVFFPDNETRQVDLNFAKSGDITAFSDGFPYLLITQASLDDLNSRMENPVTMQRFRPNLVLSGTEAFAEDNWKKIKIGNLIFDLVKPCSRCVIPSIDPQTAEKNAEVIKVLSGYRMREHKIFFGQNLIARLDKGENSQLKLGMTVEILE